MAFVRPTLATLIARAKSDIETRLPGADAQIRRTVESVLARVVAGATHGLHGHLVWLSRQIMPDTAVDELLVRWADIWGLIRTASVAATGSVGITGTNGYSCPADTLWQDANGVVYVQDSGVTIAAGVATITVTAQVGGTDGNQSAGATLSLVSPVSGIDTDGTVDGSGITGGLDQETIAALLSRLLSRLRTPPKGGGPGDYVNWALEVTGCTRAWQLAGGNGLGTVSVWFVQDDDPIDIIPSAGEIAVMQTHLDSVAPVTADVTAYGPTEVTVDITMTSLTYTGALADVKDAIEAELEDLILRIGDPSTGADLLWSQINEAISIAAGETDHVMTVPAADVTIDIGEIPKLGTITWPP